MRHPLAAAVLAAAVCLPGCARRAAPLAGIPHYVVGPGYQAGGTWYYPDERFQYDATGLATVQTAKGGLTRNGEAVDPGGMTAAHQTLQLPSVARVTNLENGLQVLVRVNDRGPATPARILAVSPRVAELLAFRGGAARVRVQVEEGPSLALREQLGGGPRLALSAAPRTAVTSEALAPPPGVRRSARARDAGPVAAGPALAPAEAAVSISLPERAERVSVGPGLLVLRAGSFGQMSYARQVAARLAGIGARVERVQEARAERYDVLAGPFASVESADAALDQAMRAGVSDARIRVE